MFAIIVILSVLAFLIAWHYVLASEKGDHPAATSNILSDTTTMGAMCGDGKIDAAEGCDDGNDIPFDGCTSCLVDGFYECYNEPSVCIRKSASGEGCGNGRVDGMEECDDGNGGGGDGCSYRCEEEPGYICPGAGPCHKRPPCGNGVIEEGEECDDGNTGDYDGCNAGCQVDNFFVCAGQPSVCTRQVFSSSSAEQQTQQTSSATVSDIHSPSMSVQTASSATSLSPRRHRAVQP